MSAILSADDLNDFISPGVACVKPVETPAESAGEVQIQTDAAGKPLDIGAIDTRAAALQPAQISLADCLACSGCITSAEEVLVAQHSHQQLLAALHNPQKVYVASISHQARASLAHAYGHSVEHMDRVLVDFCSRLGFRYVVGTAVGRKLSMLQEAERTLALKDAGTFAGPVLSSVCPGWVLYAEKTHPHVLPHMLPVKLPQQITGAILKTVVAADLGVARADVYHLAIMPCFDKKLESARPEVLQTDAVDPSLLAVPDVDCVLTPKELVNLAEASGTPLEAEPAADSAATLTPEFYAACAPPSWPFKALAWANDSGSASGGWAHNYLQLAQLHLTRTDPHKYAPGTFVVEAVGGRNADLVELRLMHNGDKVASAAVVNGFRNIQNLVRRLKPAKTARVNPLAARRRARGAKTAEPDDAADASKCDYVEIMACPNGCINGGGQIAAPLPTQEKEWLAEVGAAYAAIAAVDLVSTPDLVAQLSSWSTAFEQQVPAPRLYTTQFSPVEKPTDPNAILLGAKW